MRLGKVLLLFMNFVLQDVNALEIHSHVNAKGPVLGDSGSELGITCGIVPGCAVPNDFNAISILQNSITVQWGAGNLSTAGFELAKVRKDENIQSALKNPVFISTGNTYSFIGLSSNTEYSLFIRRVCKTATDGNYDYSDWARISAKTMAAIPSDCEFDTTIVSIKNTTHESFEISLSPWRYLHPDGRRLLVRYRLVGVPSHGLAPSSMGEWQEKLIYSSDDLKVQDLYQGGTYEVYCKQLRDGSYMEYTKACPEIGPFTVMLNNFSDACSYAMDVNINCISYDHISLIFNGPAMGYDSLRYLIAIKPVYGADDEWKFYYHFHGDEFILSDLEESTEYTIGAYLITGKSGFNYEYICSEMIVGEVTTMPRNGVNDIDGDGIPDQCDNDNTDGPNGDTDHDGVQNQDDDNTPLNPFPDMPVLACGKPVQTPSFNPNELLETAYPGEIFYINGFPILLTQITGGNGNFSGTGVIGLPFQTKYLEVEFNNIKVSNTRVVFEGAINGRMEGLNGLDEILLDTISFGEERFCKPMPEEEGFDQSGIWSSTNNEYNPIGFNQNGQYQMPPYQGWEPGDPYDPNLDPNGFDANGLHFQTQTTFNPTGCNQAGFNAQGQVCDPGGAGPYYWLEPGTTTAGIALANAIDDTLRALTMAQINLLFYQILDSISNVKIRCDLCRDSMKMYFDSLQYNSTRDRVFIFGPNDDWLREGMSEEFREPPKKLGIELDRNPNESLLENAHINLYYCDVELMRYESILSIINQLGQEPRLTEMIEYLRDLITHFTTEQSIYYSEIDNLNEWIYQTLDSAITKEYFDQYTFGYDIEHEAGKGIGFRSNNKYSIGTSNTLASMPIHNYFDYLLACQVSEVTHADIDFEYRQGRKMIAGVDRAYYLESICRSRRDLISPPNDPVSLLPLKISKDVLGRTYTIYLDSMVFTPGGATANLYMIINTNPAPDRIVFKAMNVPFGPMGFTGNTRMLLGTNVSITLSNAIKMNLFGNNNTYVYFDCEGFAGINVDGEIEFCREYIVPLHASTLDPKPDPETVKALFSVNMPSWGEFIVNLNISPFAVNKYDSIKWQVNQVIFDFSSSITPNSIQFPRNYSSPFTQNNNGVITASGLWRGLYMNNLSVTLPKQFMNSNTGESITVGAHDIIFDDSGLSGEVFASPILSLCNGDMGGWAFSVDTLAIQFMKNRLNGSSITGLMSLPIFSKGNGQCPLIDDCLRYEAVIMPDNLYSFSVSPLESYQADVWKANVIIQPSSEIFITFKDNQIFAEATLNGSISVDGDFSENFRIQLPEIHFENLVLRNKAPYFEPGIWDVPNASAAIGFGGFDLVIDTIKLLKVPNVNDKASLKFSAGIIVGDDDIGDFMVRGGFQFKSRLIINNNRQRWVYDGITVDNACLDASFPGVEDVHGCLMFFGQDNPHPIFGRGFRGEVIVRFQSVDAELSAVGVFGAKEEYRYFMIDALAKFSPGIGVGAMQLVGFGGGAAYHMDIIGDLDAGLPSNITNVDPETISLGGSLSNLIYSPDPSNGISIHATVVLALAKQQAFNINATFGISFYNNGGIDEIYFKGTARFMEDLDFSGVPQFVNNGVPTINSKICAYAYISYGFQEKQLYGLFTVKVNAAGILEGEGHAELLMKPGYWFVNIGTPEKPIQLTFTIPGLDLKIAKVGFYFDIGKNIPAFPGLPSNVAALTGLGNIVANESFRRTGAGFATGVNFDASTGDLEFLKIFYARFDLGVGFDLMIQDYGDAICINNNGEPLGINGWYASGQMWAHVHGDIGIKAHLWGKDRQFSILRLSVAAALQAKFPNPFYGRGAVGGNYRILGGLIKGKCRFEFKIGQECQIQGGVDPNQDQKIIVDLSPADSIENAYTLTVPRATFGIPLNKDLNDGTAVWRAQVVYAKILKNGIALGDEESLLEDNTILEVKPTNVLPENTWLAFKVKVQVLKNGLHFKDEEEEISFQTGKSPNIIPIENIEDAYPINGQYNFYKDEHPYGMGHITLKFGMPEMLQNNPEGYKRIMRVTKVGSGDNTSEVGFTYNALEKKIEFPMPSNLIANEVYRLEMVNKPLSNLAYASSNEDDDGGNDDEVVVPAILYRAYFRVSQYDKFAEKVNALKQNIEVVSSEGWMKAKCFSIEPMDFFEIYGGEQEPLVQTSLDLNAIPWFNTQKQRLKLSYNYYYGYNYNAQSCYIDLFTNTSNNFDQQNFSSSSIGFEESLGGGTLRLAPNGNLPVVSDSLFQNIDFTMINGFKEMWDHLRTNLISYRTWKCSGTTLWSAYPTACNTPCCSNGQYESCCTDQCVFGGDNTLLGYIHYNSMPLPGSGSKFPVLLQYRIPGYGLTTSKTIEIVKP